MNKKIIRRYALAEVLVAVFYIFLIGLFFRNADKIFAPEDSMLSPIAFLLLLVFSVAMMGLTIFGRSIMWYLDGQKKEAVKLLFYKLVYLFIVTFLIFFGLAVNK
jgi:hypothetical protein